MSKVKPISIITDSHYLDHETGGGEHPESPVRLEIIMECLQKSSLFEQIEFFKPKCIKREWLLTFHNDDWLFRFEEMVLSGKSHIDHIDNQVCYETYDVASLSAGAGLTAIDLIEKKAAKNIFCLVRPPGHHAESSMPFGFCFFNNCVVAANYWQSTYGKERILIFDFDAHHGNGIQSAFEKQRQNFYISIHEHPSFSYPGTGYADETGVGDGKGTILNLPLHPGSGDKEVLRCIEEDIEPILQKWNPDAIIVSAGFDGHLKDDMSGLAFSTELYRKIGEIVKNWSETYCDGNVLSILEGGYELTVLGESVEAYLKGLVKRR